jgi:hypothetical protein
MGTIEVSNTPVFFVSFSFSLRLVANSYNSFQTLPHLVVFIQFYAVFPGRIDSLFQDNKPASWNQYDMDARPNLGFRN